MFRGNNTNNTNNNICKTECNNFYNEPNNTNLGKDINNSCSKCMYWYSNAILGSCDNNKSDCCDCNITQMGGKYKFCDVASCLIKQMNTGKKQSGCENTIQTHFGGKDPMQIYNAMCPSMSSSSMSSSNISGCDLKIGIF